MFNNLTNLLAFVGLTTLAFNAKYASAAKLEELLSEDLFNELFPHRTNNELCTPINTYANLKNAANDDKIFLKCGDIETQKRELAAFLANISQETNGWWEGQPHNWGLTFCAETACENKPPEELCTQYCDPSQIDAPCAAGKSYHGRGPIQLSHNYNYRAASQYLYGDDRLLHNPESLLEDGKIAFQSAIWFWVTPSGNKPSCHQAMIGDYEPSAGDLACNRNKGFGATINIINGKYECGSANENIATHRQQALNRGEYYKIYTKALGIMPEAEPTLTCWDALNYEQYCPNATPNFPINMECNGDEGESDSGSDSGSGEPEPEIPAPVCETVDCTSSCVINYADDQVSLVQCLPGLSQAECTTINANTYEDITYTWC